MAREPRNGSVAIRLAKHVDSIRATLADHQLTAAHDKFQPQNMIFEKPWDQLELALIDAMYGPNMIEKAVTSLKIITSLCHTVF